MSATFKFDTKTLATIQGLKSRLGATSDAEVIQKALALAKLATSKADSDNNITISPSQGGENIKINLGT